jgi:low affinity Fe/Cu permease
LGSGSCKKSFRSQKPVRSSAEKRGHRSFCLGERRSECLGWAAAGGFLQGGDGKAVVSLFDLRLNFAQFRFYLKYMGESQDYTAFIYMGFAMKNDKHSLEKDPLSSSSACRQEDPPLVKPCKPDSVDSFFDRFAKAVTRFAGSPIMFSVAVLAVLVWALSGPYFNYSETWQLIINTGTTIITFLMVFLIQQNQNKDSKALHIKLDELIISLTDANERLIDVEELDEKQLKKLEAYYSSIALKARRRLDGGE